MNGWRFLNRLAVCLAIPIVSQAASLVTERLPQTVSGSASSLAPSMTPDGRRMVFLSSANNLTTNDDFRAFSDVFVRDRAPGTTRLVSVSAAGPGGANADCSDVSISTNGRYVL